MKSRVAVFALVLLFVLLLVFTTPRATSTLNSIATRVAAAAAPDLPTIALATPITGFSQPVAVTNAGDGSNRLFVVEQGGRIRIVKNGTPLSTSFLDISTRVSTGGERGLLGLAFPPGYQSKGRFYVDYTNVAGDTVIARYRRSDANPDIADAASEQILLTIAQPFANHNGGQLAFSPRDGMLYIGMGDGGDAGDPGNRAQNPAQLLGKILRLDVETGRPFTYTIPSNNPFVGRAGYRPEIWAIGMRNPWRFSFDRLTSDLYISDVGQGSYEEVDYQLAASAGGENYGWRVMEGLHCYNSATCSMTGLTLPVWEYDHSLGCSVTGGYVYRGAEFPRMQGLYFYGDYCSGRIWGLRRDTGVWQNAQLIETDINISTFGEDETGNLYVANISSGTIYKLVDTASPAPSPTPTPATLHFNAATLNVPEAQGSVQVSVTRSGDASGSVSVDYATADATATERGDYTTAQGTLSFAPGETQKTIQVFVTDDALTESGETFTLALSNVKGAATLVAPSSLTLTINDNDPSSTSNPIDDPNFFVRQHYVDFLSREPDAAGLQFWTNGIESCGSNAGCREAKRIDTSAAFYLSIEFQETGFLVYRLYKASNGQLPRFREFLADTQRIGRGVIVGQAGWEQQLEANKQAFVNEFVTRSAFVLAAPENQTPSQYVDALNANAGGALSTSERNTLVGGVIAGTETRATALRQVAEDADFKAAEFNRAFVLMQYFGYLRRNPNDAPDADFSGYNFWLNKLNSFGGDFRRAEMVKAFLVSDEYRRRFGAQ